jgi:malonyl-CoA/methylmalonyl-CoA synthetase
VLPLHHVHGIVNVLGCALAAGASCEMLPQFEPEPAWDRLASGEITVFSAVPTIYHRLIASYDAAPRACSARGARQPPVRLMMSGSAALPVQHARAMARDHGPHAPRTLRHDRDSAWPVESAARRAQAGIVGTPLPGVEVRLVDGELECAGPACSSNTGRGPTKRATRFHDGWFRTGDVARGSRTASVPLLGRTNVDIIKTGGYKVSALEIEEAIREHPAVADCAVTGVAGRRVGRAGRGARGGPIRRDADAG